MSEWSLARPMAGFAARLRAAEVPVSPAETADALAAAEAVAPTDVRSFAAALRACLAKTPEHRARFDAAFDAYWRDADDDPAEIVDAEADAERDRRHTGATTGEAAPAPAVAEHDTAQTAEGPAHGASAEARRMTRDLARVDDTEREAMQALIRALGRRLALRASRRWRVRRRGAFDMRASLARAISRGGEVFELRRRLRRRERPRLVVLADVSYSMDAYSRFFLCFVHAFAQAFSSVESFVFSTRLSHVRAALARGRLEDALAVLPDTVADWAGGTRIATSIETYLARFADTQLGRNTVVMIVSDGWDTDPPERLHAALARLRARCRALIWLDPLMDHPRFFASARGVQHDSPHVDICAPARNIAALQALGERLARERLV